MSDKRVYILVMSFLCGVICLLMTVVQPLAAQDTLHKQLFSPLQKDTVINSTNTGIPPPSPIRSDSLRKMHSPRKAALYSAALPGLGQGYNHQYLKIPLMYAGLGVAAGFFIFNYQQYKKFRDAYRFRVDGDPATVDDYVNRYSDGSLKFIRDSYRQYVDYSALAIIGVYLYNVIDATVFAHLYKFDVSPDLSNIKLGPVLHPDNLYVGWGLTYTFRKKSPPLQKGYSFTY